jgi:guanylate kinase
MKNNIIIISGPSGAGEDSIIDGLENFFEIERVVTTTTRDKRPRESNGNPYYFISEEEFKKKIEEKGFFEYAKHYNNNYYGVTYDEIERVKNSGKIGIWKIDYKGVIAAKKIMPEIPAIFVIAPMEVLRDRIERRGGVTKEYVEDRMKYTQEWLKHTDIYDFTVENQEGGLEETIEKVRGIVEGLTK